MSLFIRRRPAYFLIPWLAIILSFQCKQSRTGTDRLAPLPLIQLHWGESLASTAAVLTKKGWHRGKDPAPGEAHFLFEPPEVDTKNMPGANPYEITLFSREDRLVAARYIRRDVPDILAAYQSDFNLVNKLKVAYEGPESSTTTPTGNKIAEQTLILENEEFLVKNTRTKTTGAEERFASGLNDELESQIYSIEHNEGISVDRLKPVKPDASE